MYHIRVHRGANVLKVAMLRGSEMYCYHCIITVSYRNYLYPDMNFNLSIYAKISYHISIRYDTEIIHLNLG